MVLSGKPVPPIGASRAKQTAVVFGWRCLAILKRAGVTHREFYQCRHTFATLLLRGGADWQYVADQMGHADLTMLQKHYWKWRPGSTPKPLQDIIREALGE